MVHGITFNDVLIEPKFSNIKSRKNVDLSTSLGPLKLNLPIISANMDTITSIDMAKALYKAGGIGCLHRFCSIENNIKTISHLKETNIESIPSFGLGDYEFERAITLINIGVNILVLDVAHGAQKSVVDQYNQIIKHSKGNTEIIIGNFATGSTIQQFKELCYKEPLAFKVGIGGGAACLTRVQTGCGVPQLGAVIDCVTKNPASNIISDGGKKTPGDIAKALSVGAKAVMLGAMLAGTDESPGEIIDGNLKKYRGSASQEAYEQQMKLANWRTYEGDSFLVPYKGPVKKILQNIEGGLRSAFTYVGANNLREFQRNVNLIKVSYASQQENTAHGKK